MKKRAVFVHKSGEGDPGGHMAVGIDTMGGRGAGEGVVVSGLCQCFGTGVLVGVGGGCLGCVHSR